jgi:hypothetical protein
MNNINNLKNNYISNNNSDNNINTNSNTDTDTDKSFIESNNKSTELNRMNSKKRKRVVNLLVRSVGNPIQHGYVVIILLKAFTLQLPQNCFYMLLFSHRGSVKQVLYMR